jgi:hypothetical protein
MRLFRIIRLPGLPPFKLYLRPARQGAEHLCFIGACVDAAGFLIHSEAFVIVLAGKLAFCVGALGVYLLHAEERVFHEINEPERPERKPHVPEEISEPAE